MTHMTAWQRVRRKIINTIPIGVDALPLERGALSITFDDFPKNAWQLGGEVLNKHSVRGTFYFSGGLCGKYYRDLLHFETEDLHEIASAGHELGCHTFEHISALASNSSQIAQSIARNRNFLQGMLPHYTIRSFAYPY